MRQELEQVGAGQDANGPAALGDDDCVRPACQRRKHVVERVGDVDGGQRRLHRGDDVLMERVGILEDTVEQVAVLERADHVSQRLDLAVPDDRQL